MRAALENCRDNGILVISGLMLSPQADSLAYIRAIPRYLRESGLHVPTFICFESPIPGTPHFQRLARSSPSPFLAGALLRDFTGYTLVTTPAHAPVDAFIDAYRALIDEVYAATNRGRKLCDDLSRFLPRGRWLPAAVDIADMWGVDPKPDAARSLLAGSDSVPPESVPFDEADFSSEAERRRILEPWRVTDENGHVLDCWLRTAPIFAARGNSAAQQQRRARAGTSP
jgi:hypothetical protein